MAPKKPLKVTSSSTHAARIKGGSNPVVTQGAARNRAARTTLGPAPKQRPLATGGTKGPLQGGTRSPSLKMNPTKMEAGPGKVGPNLGQQTTTSSAGRRGPRPAPQAPKPAWGPVKNASMAELQGKDAVKAAQIKRTARATSERMGAIVKGAQAARNVAGALKAGIRGGALAAGLQAYNTGAGTLTANAPKIAKQISAMKNKVGPKMVGPKKVGPAKVGTITQAFDKSFAAARKAGKSEFTFKGKKYSTKMK